MSTVTSCSKAWLLSKGYYAGNCGIWERLIGPQVEHTLILVIFISCGSWQPINAYLTNASSVYPLYCDPKLELYKLLRFNATLSEASPATADGNKDGDNNVNKDGKRDYMQEAGSRVTRVLTGLMGALGNLGDMNNVGPKAQNGGEIILSASESSSSSVKVEVTLIALRALCMKLYNADNRREMRVHLQDAIYDRSYKRLGAVEAAWGEIRRCRRGDARHWGVLVRVGHWRTASIGRLMIRNLWARVVRCCYLYCADVSV